MSLLLDSNIITYLLQGREPFRYRFTSSLQDDLEFLSSDVVDFEIRRYLLLKGATKRRIQYEELTRDWKQIHLNREDWQTAAQLWSSLHKSGRPIEDRDLLIGVSAIKTKSRLVTNNPKHFADLDVELIDWST